MAPGSGRELERDRTLATVGRLVVAADGDTLYRDVYLSRATELLSTIVPKDAYAAAGIDRARLEKLLGQARHAVARHDWSQVRDLGAQAAALRRSLDDRTGLAVAESVYAAPAVVLDPFSHGLKPARWPHAAAARAEVSAALAQLAREDGQAAGLYAARQKAMASLTVADPAAGSPKDEAAAPGDAERLALQALERGDAAALEGLASKMLGRGGVAAAGGEDARSNTSGAVVVPPVLGDPVPPASVPRAEALGLEAVETAEVPSVVAQTVGDFIDRYAPGASAAVHSRSHEGIARVAAAAEGLDVPPEAAQIFAESISLFALHVFVNSAGVRYVPLPVPREALFIESHADGDQSLTPLLRELGIDRRTGLTRDDIEARLQRHGARIVRELLGLDPLAFRIVCIPPDLFVRLGRDRGWGRQPTWTHFDGYQVMKGSTLRALVGGNSEYGGIADLCTISRDDARDNTIVRFAVVRRERLGMRLM